MLIFFCHTTPSWRQVQDRNGLATVFILVTVVADGTSHISGFVACLTELIMTVRLGEPRVVDSIVSRWDARWKIASLLLLGIATVVLREIAVAATMLLICFALTLLARIPLRAVRDRLFLVFLAVLPAILVLPLTSERSPDDWRVGFITFSRPGAIAGITIAIRGLTVGCLALVIVRSDPLPQTFAAAHALRVPGVLIVITQLAYRYSFLFFEEIRRLRVGLRTRGFRSGMNSHTYRTVGHSVGSLLVRGSDRAERVADAMRCRGFNGRFRGLREFRTTILDVAGFLLCVALATALVVWDRSEKLRNLVLAGDLVTNPCQ